MTQGVADTERELNVFAPELVEDPYGWYAEMRQERVVPYSLPGLPNVRAVMLSRHADVQAVLRDTRFGRAGFRQAAANALGDGALADSYSRWFLFQDPPDHTRLRGLVSKAFTPRAVENLRHQIDDVVELLLDQQTGNASIDLMGSFAYQVPVLVICELLGVPPSDRGRFTGWSAAMAKGLDIITLPDPEAVRRGNEAAGGLTAYFRELIEVRRTRPGNDLLTALITAEEAGDRLTEDELLATCVLLFFAGHETTVNLIGNGVLALLRNPSELERLRRDPALMAGAVEEFLRYDSPVQRTGRVVLEDLEFNGRFYAQGQRVNMLIGAANRDPAQYADPDRLDVTRQNASTHLSFAAGIHYCVGAPLARLEAQLAIAALLRRYPRLRMVDERPSWRPTFVLRGLWSLELATG
ncbi:MAG TPA: cytochrome P450 [Chloroflexota bacterium]|nr:cytochrome P450 [Chloroflexota bacterium]